MTEARLRPPKELVRTQIRLDLKSRVSLMGKKISRNFDLIGGPHPCHRGKTPILIGLAFHTFYRYGCHGDRDRAVRSRSGLLQEP